MPVSLTCPACGGKLSEGFAGVCPHCRRRVGAVLQKLCTTCGADVTQQHRTRDQHGNYYCDSCWAQRARPANGSIEERPARGSCDVCHGEFPENLLRSDGGQTLCTACLDARQGQTRAMAAAAAKAVLSQRSDAKAAQLSRARASVVLAGVGLAAAVALAAFLFSGGPDRAILDRMASLRTSADQSIADGNYSQAISEYDQLFGLARQHAREAGAMAGAIEAARASHQHAGELLAAAGRAAEAEAMKHRDEAQQVREAATRWSAATRMAATRSAPGDTMVLPGGIVVKRPRNEPPTAKLVAPAEGALFTAPAEIELIADAADPDGKIAHVDFYSGQQWLGSVDRPPFRFAWRNVPEGRYRISVRVHDDSGDFVASDPAEITVIRR